MPNNLQTISLEHKCINHLSLVHNSFFFQPVLGLGDMSINLSLVVFCTSYAFNQFFIASFMETTLN